jgi:hypothetical protein
MRTGLIIRKLVGMSANQSHATCDVATAMPGKPDVAQLLSHYRRFIEEEVRRLRALRVGAPEAERLALDQRIVALLSDSVAAAQAVELAQATAVGTGSTRVSPANGTALGNKSV